MHLNQERINLFHKIYDKLQGQNIQSLSLSVADGKVIVTYSIKGDFGPVDASFHMRLNKHKIHLDMNEVHALLAICDYPATSTEMFNLYNFGPSSFFTPTLKLSWSEIEETVKTYAVQTMRTIQYDDFLVEGIKENTNLITQGRYAYIKGDFFYILTSFDSYQMFKETNIRDYIIPIDFIEEGHLFNGSHFTLQKSNVDISEVQKINQKYVESHISLMERIRRLKEKEKLTMDSILHTPA